MNTHITDIEDIVADHAGDYVVCNDANPMYDYETESYIKVYDVLVWEDAEAADGDDGARAIARYVTTEAIKDGIVAGVEI